MDVRVCMILLLTGLLAAQERHAEQPSFGSQAPLPALAGAYRSALPPLELPARPPADTLAPALAGLGDMLEAPEPTAALEATAHLPATPRRGQLVQTGVSIRCTRTSEDGQRCYKSSYADGLCHLHQPDPAYRGQYFADLSGRRHTLVIWVGACGD